MRVKRKYITVSNKLGNAILWNTGIEVIASANIGGSITTENEYVKWGLGIFAILLLMGRRISQKYIEFQTPGKSKERDSQSNEETK